jgi:hypothetical protein
MGFEGTVIAGHGTMDESLNFKGVCPNVNNASIDTTTFKWGTSSIQFTGASSGMLFNAHTDYDLGSGNFTVECWVRFNSTTGQQNFVGPWLPGSSVNWALYKSATGQLSWHVSTNGTTDTPVIDATWGPTTGVWYHVAVDWDGTKTRVYANGVMLGSDTTARTISGGNGLAIGSNSNRSSLCLNGWLDDLRVTKGVARYHSDSGFTVPSAQFPRS